jgi:phosphate-selective porin
MAQHPGLVSVKIVWHELPLMADAFRNFTAKLGGDFTDDSTRFHNTIIVR